MILLGLLIITVIMLGTSEVVGHILRLEEKVDRLTNHTSSSET